MSWKLDIQDDALSVSPIKWNVPKEIIQYSFRINNLDKLISSISECVPILLGCRANLLFLRLSDSFPPLNAKGKSWEYKVKEIHLQVPCDLMKRLDTTPGHTHAFCCLASQSASCGQSPPLAIWTMQSSLHQQGLAWARSKNQVYFHPSGSPRSPWVW